jgi:small conductance mechanosensitive channel
VSFDLHALWATAQSLLDGFLALLPNLLLGGVVFAAFVFAGRWAHRFGLRLATRFRRRGNLGLILGNLFQWALVGFGLLIALSVVIPSFQARNLIELLGIGTVAVGFAFRDILQNFFAGILILLSEPFEIGDEIKVGEFEGVVETIETRATMIRAFDGRRVVIPNTTLFTQSVTVSTKKGSERTTVDVGIGYADDVEQARAVMLAALTRVEGVRTDPPPDAIVVALANENVSVRLRWWTDSGSRLSSIAIQGKVLEAVKRALVEHGVELPTPGRRALSRAAEAAGAAPA